VDAVCTSDHHRVAVLVGSGYDDLDRTFQPFPDQHPCLLHREGECGVDDVG
jgi:hypothetical protein